MSASPSRRTCALALLSTTSSTRSPSTESSGYCAVSPGLNYLTKRYSRRWLRADSIAGLAVAAYLIRR